MRDKLQIRFEQHEAFGLRARILAKLDRPDDALADVRESMRLVEEQRSQTMAADFLKSGYSETVQKYHSLAIDLLIQAGRPGEALAVAEQGRARAFLDLLATRDVALRADNAATVAELRRVDSSLREEGANPAEFMGRDALRLRTRGPAAAPDPSLLRRWQNADPELRSFVTAEAFSSEQLAATAKRLKTTILSYWVDQDATYMWVVEPDGSTQAARSAVGRARLAQLIGRATADAGLLGDRGEGEQDVEGRSTVGVPPVVDSPALLTRGGIAVRFDPSSRDAWRQLHDVLIRPVRARLPARRGSRLTVIPHGPLFRLSFAALLDAKGRYLVEDYELHYVPAGAVLDFTRTKPPPAGPGTGRYLLIADPSNVPRGEKDRALAPLPGARDEVAHTARLLPAGAATILDGAAATEARVRQELRARRVIHFATHGIVRDDAPLDSFLAVGSTANGSHEDGKLTVQDVYGLDVQAALVFLSACRTGRGKVSGDGVVGMTRAFVYAGTPTVVASLWDVADETTRRLVPQFYRGYVGNQNAARALRAAQLRLIEDLRASRVQLSTPAGTLVLPEDPILWAAFAVFGEP
jgi:CHAT domain-containing protein